VSDDALTPRQKVRSFLRIWRRRPQPGRRRSDVAAATVAATRRRA